MAKNRLTPARIAKLRFEPTGAARQILFDTQLPGFGVRAYRSGRKVYVLQYGDRAKRRLMVLGPCTDGKDVETLDDLAGLSVRAPLAAFALAVCVFSLMGFPPTAGFLGKLYIFSSALSLEDDHVYRGPMVALARS